MQFADSNEGVVSPAISIIPCMRGSNLLSSSLSDKVLVDCVDDVCPVCAPFELVIVDDDVDIDEELLDKLVLIFGDSLVETLVEAAIILFEYWEFRADNSRLSETEVVDEGNFVDSSRIRIST